MVLDRNKTKFIKMIFKVLWERDYYNVPYPDRVNETVREKESCREALGGITWAILDMNI